nr:hypothetical protein [uncultured Campylobacter sp.]
MLPFILGGIAIAYVIKKAIDSSNESKEQKVRSLTHECSCEQAHIAAQREQTIRKSQKLNQKYFKHEQDKKLHYIKENQRYMSGLQSEIKKLPKDSQKRINRQISAKSLELSAYRQDILACKSVGELEALYTPKLGQMRKYR